MAMTDEEKKQFDEMKASVEKLTGNNKKLTDELKEEREAKRKAEEAAQAAAEEKRKAEEAKAREEKDIDKIEEGYKKKLAKIESDLEAERGKTAEANKKLTDTVAGSALNAALTEAGVKSDLLKGAAALLRSSKKVEVGDDGAVSVDGEALTDFIQGWSKSPEGAGFIAHGNSGGNASGGSDKTGGGGKPGSETKGNLGGSRDERIAALKEKFPDLAKEET